MPPRVVPAAAARPQLNTTYGIRLAGGSTSDTYRVGDVIYVSTKFTKPVTVSEGITLQLDTGAATRPGDALYYSGDGTDEIVYKYIVRASDATSSLDSYGNALSLGVGYVRRYAAGGTATTDADVSLTAINTRGGAPLRNTSDIVLLGTAPTVVNVKFGQRSCVERLNYRPRDERFRFTPNPCARADRRPPKNRRCTAR